MSMETIVTRAWQRQALWLWLLLPLSWLYGCVSFLRRKAYQLGWLSSYRAPIPVMIIGNITVGGSGKTPLIISLVHYLQLNNIKVSVISRGYGGDSTQMPALVTKDSLPSLVGDEPCLIVSMTGVPMAVCPDRQQAIAILLDRYPDLQLIIADDGLQHYALQRDIEWIVVDATRGFGNQQLLPTGFLREPISRLKDSTVIYHQKLSQLTNKGQSHLLNNLESTVRSEVDDSLLTMQLKPDTLQSLLNLETLKSLGLDQVMTNSPNVEPNLGSTVHAVSGIGYPQRFFDTLTTLGFKVIEHAYPDHYDFAIDDLLPLMEHPIIITSKDAVKINILLTKAITEQPINNACKALGARLYVLPVSAELSDTCYSQLHRQLQALNIIDSTKH